MCALEAQESDVSVFDVVSDLRNSRTLMVQTQVQYIFVYRVIEEVLDKMLCDELTRHARTRTVCRCICVCPRSRRGRRRPASTRPKRFCAVLYFVA